MKKIAALVLSLAVLGTARAGEKPAENPEKAGETAEVLPQGFTEITARQVLVETAGIGTPEFREAVEKLGKKIVEGGAESGEKELAALLRDAQALLDAEKGSQVVSVSADAQFADFIKKNPKSKIRRAEWAFQKLYFLEAFMLAEKGETDKALKALDGLLKLAPYCSDAYCERGYILNRLGQPEAALESYRQAAELAGAYGTERHNQAVALRGAGFSLTSLGKYADARQAYNKSLEYAPGNKIAQDGLAAIIQLEKNAGQ